MILIILAFFVFIVLLVFPTSFRNFLRVIKLDTVVGRLHIGNNPPEVIAIYINGTDCAINSCDFQGLEATNNTIEVKAKVSDIDLQCNETGFNATAYLCVGNGPCNAALASHIIPLSLEGTRYDTYCNYTGIDGIEYWETPGNWTINVTVNDPESSYASLTDPWINGEITGFLFPEGGTVLDFGTLTTNAWNDALPKNGNGNISWNTGNVKLNITWNATNFTNTANPSARIPIDPDRFVIDNDPVRYGGTGSFEKNLTELVPVEAYPSGGFPVCHSFNCPVDSDSGKQRIYWHLYIGTVSAGDYENKIEISWYKYG